MSMEKMSIELPIYENGFYFQRPELDGIVSRPTELLISIGAMASRLVLEKRDLVIHPDGRPENVSEHSHMVSCIATAKYRHYRDRMPLDTSEGDIALFAMCHDDIEAYVRDTSTVFISSQQLREKEVREAAGARQLYLEYKDIDPVYAERILEYERQQNPNARFTRLADKDTTLVIHFANEGETIRRMYDSKDAFLTSVYQRNNGYRMQYPEFAWTLDDRDELGEYLADVAYPGA